MHYAAGMLLIGVGMVAWMAGAASMGGSSHVAQATVAIAPSVAPSVAVKPTVDPFLFDDNKTSGTVTGPRILHYSVDCGDPSVRANFDLSIDGGIIEPPSASKINGAVRIGPGVHHVDIEATCAFQVS